MDTVRVCVICGINKSSGSWGRVIRIGEEQFNEIWQNMKNDRYLNIVR